MEEGIPDWVNEVDDTQGKLPILENTDQYTICDTQILL
jgi:hypothetical protein